MADQKKAAKSPDKKANRRGAARLAAVQALYQMEVSSAGAETVIREFAEHRFDRDTDDMTLAAADEAFTSSSVREVMPVIELDERAIGLGKPGPAARELQAALRNRAGTI